MAANSVQQIGLAGVAGMLLMLLFEYIPGFAGWFKELEAAQKRLTMLIMIVVVAVAIYGLGCIDSSPWQVVACTEQGAWDLVLMVITAIMSNQSGHSLLKKS